jgi:hypothetical protein
MVVPDRPHPTMNTGSRRVPGTERGVDGPGFGI